MVNCIEQLLDGCALAVQELHIVDHEQVDVAQLPPEARQPLAPQAFQELRGKLLGGQIDAVLARAAQCRPDPFGQVRFAAPRRPVQIQRRDIARLSDRLLSGGMSEAAGVADDKCFQPSKSPAQRCCVAVTRRWCEGGSDCWWIGGRWFPWRQVIAKIEVPLVDVRRAALAWCSAVRTSAPQRIVDSKQQLRTGAQCLLRGEQQLVAQIAANAVERELVRCHDDERSVLKTQRLAAAKPQIHAFLSYPAEDCCTQPRHDIHFIPGHFLRTLRAHRERRPSCLELFTENG